MISLNKSIFWDVDLKTLNWQRDAYFIIKRVLNYGDKEDFQKIKKVYGLSKIKNAAKKIDYINKKNINFWSIVFNIPRDIFKCTKKFSIQKPSAFLKR